MAQNLDPGFEEDEQTCSAWLSQEALSKDEKSDEPPQKKKMDYQKPKSFVNAFGFLAPEETKDKEPAVVMSTSQASALGSGKAIVVNPCQRGNPVLDLIHGVPWKFADSGPGLAVDYILGPSTGCLFLSLRYHALKPNYIHARLKVLRQGGLFALRVLLCLVDVKDSTHSVKELTKVCLVSDVTLLLAFSNEEAATYIETFKAYQNKPADSLKSRPASSHHARAIEVLSSVRSINSTDANTLLTNFESIAEISKTEESDLSLCPGIGGIKAQSLYRVFREPFLKQKNTT